MARNRASKCRYGSRCWRSRRKHWQDDTLEGRRGGWHKIAASRAGRMTGPEHYRMGYRRGVRELADVCLTLGLVSRTVLGNPVLS